MTRCCVARSIAAGLAVPFSSLVRLDDALALLPSPAGAASPQVITSRLALARRMYDSGDIARLVDGLPDLLATGHDWAGHGSDATATATLAACYDLATETMIKIGRYPQARITADRAASWAARSGSPLAVASSARRLSIVLRHQGRRQLAEQLTLRAAADLDSAGLTSPARYTAYTQMLCTSAYNAAQAGDRDRALDLIADAAQAARHLPALRAGERAAISQPQVTLYKSVSCGR